MPFLRRDFLQAALSFGLASLMASRDSAGSEKEAAHAMAKGIVMIHGANDLLGAPRPRPHVGAGAGCR